MNHHIANWPIPVPASLGSAVRAKGILQELRTHLPRISQKSLQLVEGRLELRIAEQDTADFDRLTAIVGLKLATIDDRQVLPREIEDILAITPSERRRWLADGRLPSAGIKTVKLRGRARKITFHVFEPRQVEHIRDEGLVDEWREADAERAIERRREAAWARSRAKAQPGRDNVMPDDKPHEADGPQPVLKGWTDFERDGPLG